MQSRQFDPFEVEMLWTRLVAIADEAGNALVRTSFSPIVRESKDFACVLMDAEGNSLAQNTVTVPSFCATLPRTVKNFLRRYPAADWLPGDVVLTNDPWLGTGHHPDITLALPVFHKGCLVAFAGAVAHMPDMGGPLRSPASSEIFEEGLNLPIARLYRAGVPNETLFDILRSNVRVPELTLGDIQAEIASAQVMSRHLTDLMKEYRLDEIGTLARRIHALSERAMRKAIAAVPDGDYSASVATDGVDDRPVTLHLKLSIRGDGAHFDYAGTSDQVNRSLNAVLNGTAAHSAYSLKCALNPELPNNEGAFRPISVDAPEGSILNCRRPAAVNSRSMTLHYLHAVIFGALSQAVPEKVLAECGAPSNRTQISGRRDDRTDYTTQMFTSGGMGGRYTKDGLSCTSFPTNAGASSVEVLESTIPVLVRRKELRTDSGGAGRFRGGLGQTIEYELLAASPTTLSLSTERLVNPPRGFHGGLPGATSTLRLLNREQALPAKGKVTLQQGDVIEITCPGGGGCGNPLERDRALVERDVRYGFVSPEAAGTLYSHAPHTEGGAA
jgi:N-methylhydantoinase B